MTLKDLLHKKNKIQEDAAPPPEPSPPANPEFTFMRTDTNTQELIRPPTFSDCPPAPKSDENHLSNHFSRLRSSSNTSTSSRTSIKGEKRRSLGLHFRSHSRSSSRESANVPTDLPEIQDIAVHNEEKQAQWEERATILARGNSIAQPPSRNAPPRLPSAPTEHPAHLGDNSKRPEGVRRISDAKGDETIQEAIRLHEAGDLVQSTAMFGRLADTNAMAQILYGLALRHGWGIPPDPSRAIAYLSQAASNSASVESTALNAGMKKGGAAKGELVLAIYELANSFRHGWGVEKDLLAARKYYETAANLGDTDAMNEAARCYEEGLGGKKDKVSRKLCS